VADAAKRQNPRRSDAPAGVLDVEQPLRRVANDDRDHNKGELFEQVHCIGFSESAASLAVAANKAQVVCETGRAF
jgi:hypothetical protein